MIVYVDDILITSSSKAAEEKVVQTIAAIVPTKTTGVILPAALGGGTLQFIGRTIERPKDEECIFLSISPKYRPLMSSRSKENHVLCPIFRRIWRKLILYLRPS